MSGSAKSYEWGAVLEALWRRARVDKQHIIDEIKRTAAENGGAPLGSARFAGETGIAKRDWYGKVWRSWGDALVEAGFQPNQFNVAYARNWRCSFASWGGIRARPTSCCAPVRNPRSQAPTSFNVWAPKPL